MFAASACVTVAFTVSITRYRLMQLDQLISSGVVYFLISFVAGLVYYGLVFAGMLLVGSQVGEGPSLAQALAVSSTALVLMVALDLLRGRLQARPRPPLPPREAPARPHAAAHEPGHRAAGRSADAGPAAAAHSAELLGVPRGAVYLRQGEPAAVPPGRRPRGRARR